MLSNHLRQLTLTEKGLLLDGRLCSYCGEKITGQARGIMAYPVSDSGITVHICLHAKCARQLTSSDGYLDREAFRYVLMASRGLSDREILDLIKLARWKVPNAV